MTLNKVIKVIKCLEHDLHREKLLPHIKECM